MFQHAGIWCCMGNVAKVRSAASNTMQRLWLPPRRKWPPIPRTTSVGAVVVASAEVVVVAAAWPCQDLVLSSRQYHIRIINKKKKKHSAPFSITTETN
ncbi:Hypothetical protein, putative [Bodo saltans]|uniref:Uncharacterized protein n=1 Tax=Bodo saltans TaxID=75058 RepID=A0A0S4INL3_BODSA|nr:Hypothetical protein, putative [Bodo saltans]|eukprot:CUE87964.1 Hypothetical protein, putative [Bodo saltans]